MAVLCTLAAAPPLRQPTWFVLAISPERLANARFVGARLAAGLRRLAEGRPAVGEVRAKGLMLAVELVEPGTRTPAPTLAAQLQEEARRGGLLVGKGGLYGNVLRIAPPLIVTEAEADEGLEILAHAFTTLG